MRNIYTGVYTVTLIYRIFKRRFVRCGCFLRASLFVSSLLVRVLLRYDRRRATIARIVVAFIYCTNPYYTNATHGGGLSGPITFCSKTNRNRCPTSGHSTGDGRVK